MMISARNRFFQYKALAILAVCTVFAGCTVGPDYRKPETSSPATFRFDTDNKAAPLLASDWWTIFGDPELNRHVEAALVANQDLALAVARFDESRALLGVARSSEYPNASVDPFYARSQPSDIVAISPALIKSLYVIPAEVGYEVDFWGRVRRSVNAARAQLASNADAVASVRLSLAADTTVAYLLLRSDDREVAVLQQTLKVRDEALQLAERRADAGVVSDIDVVRARADRALTEADLKEVQRRRELTQHAMAVLEGKTAPEFELAPDPRVLLVPDVPAGLPSQFLERRPDVAQRERALAAASEQIGIAEASFFPTITLTALGGIAGDELFSLIHSPSRLYSIGPNVTFPFFDGGLNRSNFEAAQARYREALAQYREITLVAFRDTQDALSDIAYLRDLGAALHEAVVNSTEAATISRSRYDRGEADYFEVVDSERAALTNQRAEIQNDQLRLSAVVALIKALGGGWTADAPVPELPAEPAPGHVPFLPTAISPQ